MTNLNDHFQALAIHHDGDYQYQQMRFDAMTDQEKLHELHSRMLFLSYDIADLKQTLASIYPLLSSWK